MKVKNHCTSSVCLCLNKSKCCKPLCAQQIVAQRFTKTAIAAEIPSLGQRKVQELAKEVLAIKDQNAVDLRKLLGKRLDRFIALGRAFG